MPTELKGTQLQSGTAPNDVVVLDGTSRLPAVDASLVVNAGSTSGVVALKSATTVISVGTATAPTVGQVLKATSSTAATWQNEAGGGGGVDNPMTVDLDTGGYNLITAAVSTAADANDIILQGGANSYAGGGFYAGDIQLVGGAGTNGNYGGYIDLTSGGGEYGGRLSLTAGDSTGATSYAGFIAIVSGNSTTDTSGVGGEVRITGGEGHLTGGYIRIISGDVVAASVNASRSSGTVTIQSAAAASGDLDTGNVTFGSGLSAAASGTTGNVTLSSGSTSAASGISGNVTVSVGGSTGTTSTGGNLTLRAGNGTSTSGTLLIAGGQTTTSGNGGTTTVRGGDATSGTGGDLILRGGSAFAVGDGGNITLTPGEGNAGAATPTIAVHGRDNTIDQGQIEFWRDTNVGHTTGNFVSLKAGPTLAVDVSLILPETNGNANDVLISDGAGVLSFGIPATVNALESATTTVNVSSATAPTINQVLTATSGTAATWQDAGGGGVFTEDADDNIFAGTGAGANLSATNALINFLVGPNAGNSITGGDRNVAIGSNSGQFISTGNDNIAIGGNSMVGITGTKLTGGNNIAIGNQSMITLQGAGTQNVALGSFAGQKITTGTNNTCLGYNSGNEITTGVGNVVVGSNAGPTANQSNKLYIDNTETNTPLIFGDFTAEEVTVNGTFGVAKQSTTLGVAATVIAITSNFVVVTGDGGANTVATITGGQEGQVLVLLFVDANVTITDDNAHGADSVDLSAAFTSADDTTLTLIYDGTSWYETSRSVN